MTTPTIKQVFEYALLARAAYMDLSPQLEGIPLKNLLELRGMTPAMADYISKRYKVYDSYTSGGLLNPIGYQGIIFQEIGTQNYVLANRGTEAATPQDLIADIILATTGTNPQTERMEALYAHIPDTATRITTTGHSLGGYLSKMALVKWGNVSTKKIDYAYTYNGAGINNYAAIPSIWNAVLGFLGLDPQTITNPSAVNYITAENPEIVVLAGVHPGEIRMVNTDMAPPIGSVLGHGMANLANALLVAYVFAHIDSTLDSAYGLQKINAMVEAMSGISTMDGNGAIAALAKLFGLNATIINKSLYESDEKEKESNLQKLAFDLLVSPTGSTNTTTSGYTLIPLITVAANGTPDLQLATQNINSLAYRYALKELNPFVVEGLDYSSFNINGELNDYNEDTGEGSLTEEWLQNRQIALSAFMAANIYNSDSVTHTGANKYNITLFDQTLGLLDGSYRTITSNSTQSGQPTLNIYFGAPNKVNVMAGSLNNDSMFGGMDNDVLSGLDGEDYIEGGIGNDALYGDGGNDQLEGGFGNDLLVGGEGDDTYIFTAGDGSDTIGDNQGNNTLKLNGQSSVSATQIAKDANVYQDEAGNRYTLLGIVGLQIDLVENGGSISLTDWSDEDTNNNGVGIHKPTFLNGMDGRYNRMAA